MAKLPRLKLINLEKCKVACHVLAKDAYEVTLRSNYQCDLGKLSPTTVSLSQQFTPLQVTQSGTNHFEFFSGWIWLIEAKRAGLKTVLCAVHPKENSPDISLIAWAYALQPLLLSHHRHRVLADMSTLLGHLPHKMRPMLFESISQRSGTRMTERLTGSSREAVRHQQTQVEEKNQPADINILQELLKRQDDSC